MLRTLLDGLDMSESCDYNSPLCECRQDKQVRFCPSSPPVVLPRYTDELPRYADKLPRYADKSQRIIFAGQNFAGLRSPPDEGAE